MEFYRKLRPPAPNLTESNLPDQTNKVFIITGANSGVGEQLAKILYSHNATVYAAARSRNKATESIKRIKSECSDSKGEIFFLELDLSDLTTVKKAADDFLSKESRLDVLWLNAGVMAPPDGSTTAQGYELQLGTNNLGHFLLVQYLHSILAQTATRSPKNSVRVIWVSSSAADLAPNPAIDFDNMDYQQNESAIKKYARSKAGNVIHAVEFARRTEGEGILSLSLNPGNLKSGLQRHFSRILLALTGWMLYPPIYGAYTELYAGLSSDISEANNAGWVGPWGRVTPIRKDLTEPGLTQKYWQWSEMQVKDF